MIRHAGAALLLLSLVSTAFGQLGESSSTVLHVAAWTTTGERINKIWVVISLLDGREKYKSNGSDVALSIPTGEYILQVEAPGFQSKRQLLKAYQPSEFRSITLPVTWMHGQTVSSLSGVVKHFDGDFRHLRVRLMGLYGNELRESMLDAQGSFSFPADEGPYLLVVVADLEKGIVIVDSQPVRIFGEQTIVIDLTGKHGAMLPLAAP